MSSDELPRLFPEGMRWLGQNYIYGSERGIEGEIQSPIKTKVTEHRLENDKTIDGQCSELKTLSNPILKLDA